MTILRPDLFRNIETSTQLNKNFSSMVLDIPPQVTEKVFEELRQMEEKLETVGNSLSTI